jgi:hypothetical protein
MSRPRIYRYVRGGEPRFVPLRPAIRISDDDLTALRLAHPGSTGHPRGLPRRCGVKTGLRAIAAILGCSEHVVRYRLRKIAEREES